MGRDVKSRGHRRHHASGCHSPKETTRKQRGATALRPPLAFSGGETRIRTEDKGFAGLCLSHLAISPYETGRTRSALLSNGAGYGVRTRDLHLGKVARYQLRQARERTDTIRDPVARCKHDFEKAWLSWSTGGRSADDGSPGCLATISCRAQLPSSFSPPQTLCPSRADASGPTRPVMRGFPLWAGMGYALLALSARLVRSMESHAYQYPHALPSVPPCSCRPLSDTGLLAVARSRQGP